MYFFEMYMNIPISHTNGDNFIILLNRTTKLIDI